MSYSFEEVVMDFVPLFEGELRYTALESLDYEAGGQLYGTMVGEVTGERASLARSSSRTSPRDGPTM